MIAPMPPEFLNVDLELESKSSLDLIAQEFGDRIHVLHNGPLPGVPYLLAVEIYAGHRHDPESIIGSLCDLAESLSPRAKSKWKQCSVRRFDIGIESGTSSSKRFDALCISLSPATTKRIAALAAEVVMTVYPPLLPKTQTEPKVKARRN